MRVAALHLLYTVVCPEHLVEFFDEKGTRVNLHSYDAKIDGSHIPDMLAGGFAAAFLASKALISACTKDPPASRRD